ncbi:MAG TPA: beta-propeller fold lactonase family protein [Bryobacteraceae bacterium]|jgi:YVTN family beta-propeller protein
MKPVKSLLFPACCALLITGCSQPQKSEENAAAPAAPKGEYRLYVSNETSGDMTVIDSSNFEVVENVHLGKRPRGIHASPDGKLIYVALSGSPIGGPNVDESKLPPPDKSADGIGVFDIAQNKLVKVIQGGSDPENFAVSADGKWIYVSNEDDDGVSFIDLTLGKLVPPTIKTGEEPEGVSLTPDGKLIYSTAEADGTVSVIDPATKKLVKTFKVGRRPRNVVFMPDGKRAYVNAENDGTIGVIDTTKNALIHTIPLGKPGEIKPMGEVLSPDGSKLYVSTGKGKSVFVIDTATNKVETSFEVGQRPWGIALSPDGKTLFTANGPSQDVSIIDTATNTVTKKVKCTGGPWGIQVLKN